MAVFASKAAVRGNGPPWSFKQSPEWLPPRQTHRPPDRPSPCRSPVVDACSMESYSPDDPQDLEWLSETQMSAYGDLTVTERLGTLLDTGQFADVTIRVGQGGDSQSFKAHRLLLATASQPLHRLVSTCQSGSNLNTFRVTDVDPEAFKNVLKFIYTDAIYIKSILDAFSLLKAGQKFNLKKMNGKTVEYLDTYLDTFDADDEEKKNEIFDLLNLAKSHSEELFEKCLSTIIKFANQIIPCQGFLRLDELMIRRIIGHKDFVYEDQLKLFEAIRDWGMNQILLKGLNPTKLHPTIEDLIKHVKFDQIKDNDFLGTIIPSECLGRAEVISFFLSRGQNVPREVNGGVPPSGEAVADSFKKVVRFKKGYRLPHKEIYQEHEVRFRVDSNVRLLGLGFGFLFSQTDMGVVIHCQGPWERVQWTDMTQTYCRVSADQLKSADVRLMFSEPPRLEANHCYKVVVKVTRMTAGSTDVEMWGGQESEGICEAEDAKFHFIKAAVNPKNEVDPREIDNKQGMVTELLYVADDAASVPELPTSPKPFPKISKDETPLVSPEIKTTPPTYVRKRPLKPDTDVATTTRRRLVGSSYSSTPSETVTTKTSEPEFTPAYLRKKPVVLEDKPAFLRSRAPSITTTSDSPWGDKLQSSTRPSWRSSRTSGIDAAISKQIGTTPKPTIYGTSNASSATTGSNTTATPYSRYRTKDPVDTDSPSKYPKDLPSLGSTYSSIYGGRDVSSNVGTKVGSGLSSKYETDSTKSTNAVQPKYGRDSSVSKVGSALSSKYETDSSKSTNAVQPKYGRDSSVSKDSISRNRYGRDSITSRDGSQAKEYGTSSTYGKDYKTKTDYKKPDESSLSTTRYGRDSSTRRDSTNVDSNSSRYSRDSSTSRYGRDLGTTKTQAPSTYSTRYGSRDTDLNKISTPRFGDSKRYGEPQAKVDPVSTDSSFRGRNTSLYTPPDTSLSRFTARDRDTSASRVASRYARDLSASSYGSPAGSGYSSYSKYSSGYAGRFR